MNRLTVLLTLGFVLTQIVCVSIARADGAPMPRLHVDGERIVAADGKPVFLHGVNLGNWLLFEPGGLGGSAGKIADQYTLFSVLRERFGEPERWRLIGLYRDNFITARDFDNVKRFGFNFVRIGFDHDLFEDDEHPMQLRPDAFKYLDFAVREAKARGIYILFDLHGAAGNQSKGKQSGRVGGGTFWDDAKDQERSLWLWAEVFKHFRGETTIMGYEPLNEPFAAKKEQLRDYCARWYKQLREFEPDSIAVFPGLQNSIEFFGRLADNGWTNAIIDNHFYPGSFIRPTATQPATPRVNVDFLQRSFPRWIDRMHKAGVPMVVGEMNVVFKEAGGGEMVRRYYDFCEQQGWAISFWTLKELTPGGGIQQRGWMLTTNAGPIPPVDIRTSSKEEIETAFRNLGTMPLATDEDLFHWLTTDQKPSPLKPSSQPSSQSTTEPTGVQPD